MLRALLEAADGSSVLHELALGPFPARVVVDARVVKTVTAGPFQGEDALFRLLLGNRRGIRSRPAESVDIGVEPGLGTTTALLERFDKAARDLERAAARAGGFARVWAVRYLALRTLVVGLPDDVKRVVRLLDGTRDLRTLLAESPLPPSLSLRVVERLLQEGALERADLDAAKDAFSAAVEAPVAPAETPATTSAASTPDRSWLQERAARTVPPEMKPAEPASAEPVPMPPVPMTSLPTTAPTTAPPTTTTTPTPTTPTTTTTPPTTTPPTTTTNAEPVVLSKRRPTTSTAGSLHLPNTAPKVKPELSTWLGPEDEFFAAHDLDDVPVPVAAGWPAWTLAALVLVGAVVGAVVARACVS